MSTLRSARNRRTEHSSSDSSEVGQFLVSNVKFRVAAPPARPLPVDDDLGHQDCILIHKILGNALEDGVDNILEANNIKPLEPTSLVFRSVQGDSSQGQPTILVVADWDETSPTTWERAVKRAKQLVDATVLESKQLCAMDIAVEFIAKELTLGKYISAIPPQEFSESLAEAWGEIKYHVSDILDRHPQTKERLTSISLFKLGFSDDINKNPLTLYISLDYESEETRWPPVVEEIQKCLDRYPYDLRVHLEHNCPTPFPGFELLLRNMTPEQVENKLDDNYSTDRRYNSTVGLGEDICPAGYLTQPDGGKRMPGVGTLGCWVEIRTRKVPEWTKYALTCYHVTRPAIDGFQLAADSQGQSVVAAPRKDSDLWKADLGGICPNPKPEFKLQSRPLRIEHPTRAKHCFAVQVCQEEIAANPPSAERTKTEQYLSEITAFFDNGNHIFGEIYAASGYGRRSRQNGRMDWALIRPLDGRRVGDNKLPTTNEWRANKKYLNLPLFTARGSRLKQPPANGLRSTSNGEHLYKNGTSTGPTVGVFSHLKSDVRIHEDAHLVAALGPNIRTSEEFVYIGEPQSDWLAKNGDSGSVVFDREGRAVGLLFRGHRAQNASNTYCYITPIEDIFYDIKDFSKGSITEIRIAEG